MEASLKKANSSNFAGRSAGDARGLRTLLQHRTNYRSMKFNHVTLRLPYKSNILLSTGSIISPLNVS